jgi:hypothetical protein
MGSPTLHTLQDPILLTPWRLDAAFQTLTSLVVETLQARTVAWLNFLPAAEDAYGEPVMDKMFVAAGWVPDLEVRALLFPSAFRSSAHAFKTVTGVRGGPQGPAVVVWCLRKAGAAERAHEPAVAVPLLRLPTAAEPTALAALHVADHALLVVSYLGDAKELAG